jgi:hypothetical protein
MHIGVFGDSYAEKSFDQQGRPVIWYQFLKENYGHTIDCYGEGGSSIMFSARLIDQLADQYDLVIWCLTCPGRVSFVCNDQNYHVSGSSDRNESDNQEIQKKRQVFKDYLKWVFDHNDENFIGRAIVADLTARHKNIMIIPCFPPPLGSEFNLWTVCEQEAQHYFPGKTIPEIYQKYNDQRPGHITSQNQEILADLINQNLQPGIFQTKYEHFVRPDQLFNHTFIPL